MDNHVKHSVGRNFYDCTAKVNFKGFAKQRISVSVSIGYVDGSIYEEINDVQLQKVTEEEQKQFDYMEQLQSQKQQQQQ